MRKILYVITNYYRNAWYCGFSPPFSDRIYYKEQMVIISRLKDIVGKSADLSLTIKLYPNPETLDDDPPWTTDLSGIPKIHLVRNPAFSLLMRSFDILLIDSPTTTLLQAIATRKPVFVLTSVVSPPSAHLPLLKKRAVCSDRADGLMDALNAFIQTNIYPADCEDREFLKLYGTCLDDGHSHRRVENIIKKYLERTT